MRFIPPSIPWSSVPSSETATGSVGQIAYDSQYQYHCVATNLWRRTPLAPWLPVTSGLLMRLDTSVGVSLYQSNGGSLAASTDNPVGYWTDTSGLGNNATQATSGLRPLLKLNSQNGRPGIQTDGVDDYFVATVSGFNTLAATTIVLVAKTQNATSPNTEVGRFFSYGNFGTASGSYPSNRGFFLAHSTGALTDETIVIGVVDPGSGNGRLGSSSYSRGANTAQVITTIFANSGAQLFANNSAVSLNLAQSGYSASTPCGPADVAYTADNDIYFNISRSNGSLGSPNTQVTYHEILVYNRALTSDERTSLWNYLSAKWGIS